MQKIDTKCFQSYRPIKKEDKDFGKNKSANNPLVDIFSEKQQSFIYQTNKKEPEISKRFLAI